MFQSQFYHREFAFFLTLGRYPFHIHGRMQKNYIFKINTVFLFPLFTHGLGNERLLDSVMMKSGTLHAGSMRKNERGEREKMLPDYL